MNAKTSCHPQLVGMLANLEPFGGSWAFTAIWPVGLR